MLEKLAGEIMEGRRLRSVAEVLGEIGDTPNLLEIELDTFMKYADKIRRFFCGDKADLCGIINGKSGRCSEDCKFCAQSCYSNTGVEEYNFLDADKIISDCELYDSKGVNRYSVVTAGRTLQGEDLNKATEVYEALCTRFPEMKFCGSHGLMSRDSFAGLKEAGVDMIHCNIETSRRYFPYVCSTHSFDEKLAAIETAKNLGLKICCGGIIGMGETWNDRIDMALTIAETGAVSIPINTLIPISGTPFESQKAISQNDILRTVAIFRFINPEAYIRIAAGRFLFEDGGSRLFRAGANATITGDMLTTVGNNTTEDRRMLTRLGFSLRKTKC